MNRHPEHLLNVPLSAERGESYLGWDSLENGQLCFGTLYLGVGGVAGDPVKFSVIESRVVKFVVLCEMSLMISA